MAHTQKGMKRQEKLERRRKREQRVVEVLAKHNRKREKKRRTKRKTYEEMQELMNPKLWKPHLFVRRPEDWTSPTYNEEKQFYDFGRHLYCKYDTPYFLLSIFSSKRKKGWRANSRYVYSEIQNFELFSQWFFDVATGRSFYKENKAFFTKKEAHLFLNSPAKYAIEHNFWRAKGLAAGAGPRLVSLFMHRFGNAPGTIWDEFFYEVVKFFARFEKEIHIETLNDVMDFIFNKHANDKSYSLKGRTYSSLIKASNEWHRDMHYKQFGNRNYSWDPLPLDKWSWKDKVDKCNWAVEQLCTSKELYAEGKRMRHCVASYAEACRLGRSFIFSLRRHDGINAPESVLTIEVTQDRRVVQSRGKLNRHPTGRAAFALKKWMADNGLVYRSHFW